MSSTAMLLAPTLAAPLPFRREGMAVHAAGARGFCRFVEHWGFPFRRRRDRRIFFVDAGR